MCQPLKALLHFQPEWIVAIPDLLQSSGFHAQFCGTPDGLRLQSIYYIALLQVRSPRFTGRFRALSLSVVVVFVGQLFSPDAMMGPSAFFG
jgi:hypothetical protein